MNCLKLHYFCDEILKIVERWGNSLQSVWWPEKVTLPLLLNINLWIL